MTRTTIVGSGLAGALLACYFGRRGWPVSLYERRPDPRGANAERGRSINLALSTRGLRALEEVGLKDDVLRQAVTMRGRMIHHPDGALAFQPYGKDETQVLHSVSRAGLNRLLVEAASAFPCVELAFEHRCIGADIATSGLWPHRRGERRGVSLPVAAPHRRADAAPLAPLESQQLTSVLTFAVGAEVREVPAEVIVGADGAYSAVRAAMQKRERFDYSQDYLGHGYKELTIAPGTGGAFRLEKHALHIWPRGGFMMIALPNADGSFTCTLFWPYEGPNSFSSLRSDDDVRTFFQTHFPDAVPLLPDLAEQYRANPIGPLVTIRCQPWHVGRAVLIGDACHAVVPFLGQGMNAAFEDCATLVRCLEAQPDPEAAFAAYGAARKPHLDALADLCVDNFLEMRDKVGSRLFLLRKKLHVALHALLPRLYLPLYTMVEFTTIPYADAVRRARQQGRVAAGLGLMVVLAALLWLAWLGVGAVRGAEAHLGGRGRRGYDATRPSRPEERAMANDAPHSGPLPVPLPSGAMPPPLPPRPPITYPDSDGKPMSDNTKQARWIATLYGNFEALYRDRADVFVAMDLLWYPVEGEPQVRAAPDVMVVFGRPKGDRGSYKQWEENDVPVTVAFEVLSPGNSEQEMIDKYHFYEEHGVKEYYVYDPDANKLDVYLRKGDVFRRTLKVEGFISPQLGVRFEPSAKPEMAVYDPDGQPFHTFKELAALQQLTLRQRDEEKRRADDADKRADDEKKRADDEKKRADDEKKRADDATRRADEAIRRAARLTELGRKARLGQASADELAELERLEEQQLAGP